MRVCVDFGTVCSDFRAGSGLVDDASAGGDVSGLPVPVAPVDGVAVMGGEAFVFSLVLDAVLFSGEAAAIGGGAAPVSVAGTKVLRGGSGLNSAAGNGAGGGDDACDGAGAGAGDGVGDGAEVTGSLTVPAIGGG